MSNTSTTYTVEYPKSARSKCKRCKESLAVDEMRLHVIVPSERFASNYHVGCYMIPRKYSKGAEKMHPADFVRKFIEDGTVDHSILPARLNEIIELIEKGNTTEAVTIGATKRKKSESESNRKNSGLLGQTNQADMPAANWEDSEVAISLAKKRTKSDTWDKKVLN